jgi:hypothetical protein
VRTWIRPLALLPFLLLPALSGGEQAALAQPKHAAPAGPSAADARKATQLYQKGADLFTAKKYALALEEFRASYAAVASPNSHLYIARCLAATGDPRAAYLEFDKVVVEADARAATEAKYAPTRDTAKVEREEQRTKIALVTVTVAHADASTTLQVGGQSVTSDKWGTALPLLPGSVDVVIQTGTTPPVHSTLTVAAGERRDLALDAAPPPPSSVVAVKAKPVRSSRAGLRTAAFVAGGVGVVGFGMALVGGLMASSTYSSLQSSCPMVPCSAPGAAGHVSSGNMQEALANVGLVVGALGIATGATLFVLSTGGKAKKTEGAELRVGPGYGEISGRF